MTLKLLAIVALVVLLLLPLHLIESLIEERELRQRDVETELKSELGSELTLTGPLLVVPTLGGRRVHLWADDVVAKTEVAVEPRYRGIFAVRAFRSTTTMSGGFQVAANSLNEPADSIDWRAARLMLFWSLPTREPISTRVTWAERAVQTLVPDGCITEAGCMTAAVDATNLGQGTRVAFSLAVELTGVDALTVKALGRATTVQMSSPWPSPSFLGPTLPLTRSVSAAGFQAEWRHTRSSAAPLVDTRLDLPTAAQHARAASVSFVDPVGHYLQVTRAVKYGLLVVLITFTAFFLFEVIAGLHIHPIQYLLVGGALTVFYLLLLSISEHLGFAWAYAASAVAVLVLLTGYATVILKARRRTAGFAIGLAAQYGVLFVILRAEDFALLTGSVALFLLLAAVMYLTRNVDWYGSLDHRSTTE